MMKMKWNTPNPISADESGLHCFGEGAAGGRADENPTRGHSHNDAPVLRLCGLCRELETAPRITGVRCSRPANVLTFKAEWALLLIETSPRLDGRYRYQRGIILVLALKKKTTFLDWANLIAFGSAGTLVYHLILGACALVIGLLVATFSEIEWYFAALISYLGLRLVLGGIDAFSGLRSARCQECNRKIMTSKPIKCEECGGAGRLVGKKYEANEP